jgi:hypothetical protein
MNEEYKAFNTVVGIGPPPPTPNPQQYTTAHIRKSSFCNKERRKTQRVGWEAAIIAVCAVLEFLNNLLGLGTEKEQGCRTSPPGGIDSLE